MKISLLAPYGGFSQESGVMYLLANYLRSSGMSVSQLRCNGVFSLCDRDGLSGWRRTLSSCLECAEEQRALAEWGTLKSERLSESVTPDMVQATKRVVLSHTPEELWDYSWEGVSLRQVLAGSFARRFGVSSPDFRNKAHRYAVQRLGLSAMRMISASAAYVQKNRPDCTFVASGDDFISASYCASAEKKDAYLVRFKWDLGSRMVRIYYGDNNPYLSCEILLDSISSVRSDISTWPPELITILDELLEGLGLSESHLQLPIAQ